METDLTFPAPRETVPTAGAHVVPSERRLGVYERLTQRIVELLETGTVPWHKPWNVQIGPPRNLISKRPYRGINVFLLLSTSYESPFWLTFNQVHQLGGYVRQGEKACPVVFWKQATVEDKETGEGKDMRLLRLYHVFNTAQCEKLQGVPSLSEQLGTFTQPAEIVAHMPRPPTIKHGMTGCFYSPAEDAVGMVSRERFAQEEEYFSALFHELVHSTGHESRLKRPSLATKAGFGSDPYCKEELIAEMGAAFLCAHAGIIERTVENSAAYLRGWLQRLMSDKTLIVQAAAQAQLAVDYILAKPPEQNSTEAESPTPS